MRATCQLRRFMMSAAATMERSPMRHLDGAGKFNKNHVSATLQVQLSSSSSSTRGSRCTRDIMAIRLRTVATPLGKL